MRSSHKLMCVAAALALAGCAGLPHAPVATTVEIAVAEKCEAPVPQRPAFAVDALPVGAEIDEQMKALRAERQQRKGYEHELETAVQACR